MWSARSSTFWIVPQFVLELFRPFLRFPTNCNGRGKWGWGGEKVTLICWLHRRLTQQKTPLVSDGAISHFSFTVFVLGMIWLSQVHLKSCTEKFRCLVYKSPFLLLYNFQSMWTSIYDIRCFKWCRAPYICLKIALSGFGKYDVPNPIILYQVLANTSWHVKQEHKK